MDDPPAAITGVTLVEPFVGPDHLLVRCVADRMDCNAVRAVPRLVGLRRSTSSVRNCRPRVPGMSA